MTHFGGTSFFGLSVALFCWSSVSESESESESDCVTTAFLAAAGAAEVIDFAFNCGGGSLRAAIGFAMSSDELESESESESATIIGFFAGLATACVAFAVVCLPTAVFGGIVETSAFLSITEPSEEEVSESESESRTTGAFAIAVLAASALCGFGTEADVLVILAVAEASSCTSESESDESELLDDAARFALEITGDCTLTFVFGGWVFTGDFAAAIRLFCTVDLGAKSSLSLDEEEDDEAFLAGGLAAGGFCVVVLAAANAFGGGTADSFPCCFVLAAMVILAWLPDSESELESESDELEG